MQIETCPHDKTHTMINTNYEHYDIMIRSDKNFIWDEINFHN